MSPATTPELAAILLYHRVGTATADPWALAVSLEHFEEHMQRLRRDFLPVRLEDLLDSEPGRDSGARRVAVTFDDGYAETMAFVRPILERLDIPATVFVPSGSITQVSEFWWDDLERMLLGPGHLPETLVLEYEGGCVDFTLGTCAVLTPSQVRATRPWCAWQEPPTRRHALYATLWRICQRSNAHDRARIIGEVRAWSGADARARLTHRPLRSEELISLSRSDLMAIGGHTVSHPMLSALNPVEQLYEIRTDKLSLEQLTGGRVNTFAYPFGKPTDYTEETVTIVRDAGFTVACSNVRGAASLVADRHQLPRLFVSDWNGSSFGDSVVDVLAAEGAALR
jgi:peptidoglycan/xylan/chitin deacetylase (PgdA/CDA1 family)